MAHERYDKYFGGERGSADKTLHAMKKTYGRRDGEHVFWASVAKRKRKQKGLFGRPKR